MRFTPGEWRINIYTCFTMKDCGTYGDHQRLLVWMRPLAIWSVAQIVQDKAECHLYIIQALPMWNLEAVWHCVNSRWSTLCQGLRNKEWERIISSTYIYCLQYKILYFKNAISSSVKWSLNKKKKKLSWSLKVFSSWKISSVVGLKASIALPATRSGLCASTLTLWFREEQPGAERTAIQQGFLS